MLETSVAAQHEGCGRLTEKMPASSLLKHQAPNAPFFFFLYATLLPLIIDNLLCFGIFCEFVDTNMPRQLNLFPVND